MLLFPVGEIPLGGGVILLHFLLPRRPLGDKNEV